MIYGFGLIKGLYVTAKRFLSKKVTEQYPDVLPNLPPRSHGSFAFNADQCIACNICADVCPNGVIKVDFFKNEKGKKVLENYHMNLGYCMFCGLCVESCPKDAIYFKTDFNLSCFNKGDTMINFRGNVYRSEALSETKTSTAVKTGQEVQ
jgi:NADH-quinone oxidoreductase subunit I